MIDVLRPKDDTAKRSSAPPPQPSEIRDVGEYRTVAPDGTVEVVKKRIVVYDSPIPCNTEANRTLAEQRRSHRDPSGGDGAGFFASDRSAAINKEQLRRDIEGQIAKKREEDARRKALDAQTSKAVMQQAAESARVADEAQRRRAESLREQARSALQTSAPRARQSSVRDAGATSLAIGDGGAAAARTREINRAAAEVQRRELETKQRRHEELRRERQRTAVAESERAKQAEAAHREAQRQAKVADQQKAANDLQRSRDDCRRQREAAAQQDKTNSASIVAAAVGEQEARQCRETERRRQMKAAYAETARRELEAKEAAAARKAPSRVVSRDETTVLMRCPKSGKLLPPSAFNIRRRQ